jgi:hypothetical protein
MGSDDRYIGQKRNLRSRRRRMRKYRANRLIASACVLPPSSSSLGINSWLLVASNYLDTHSKGWKGWVEIVGYPRWNGVGAGRDRCGIKPAKPAKQAKQASPGYVRVKAGNYLLYREGGRGWDGMGQRNWKIIATKLLKSLDTSLLHSYYLITAPTNYPISMHLTC